MSRSGSRYSSASVSFFIRRNSLGMDKRAMRIPLRISLRRAISKRWRALPPQNPRPGTSGVNGTG